MRPPKVSTILLLVFLGCAVPAVAQSPGAVGEVTRNFSLPQVDAQGRPESNLMGAEARMVSPNRTEITGLKVELYEEGTLTTTITAPQSDLWTASRMLRAREGVTIERPGVVITARTMDWDTKNRRGVLGGPVRVALEQFSLVTGQGRVAPK